MQNNSPWQDPVPEMHPLTFEADDVRSGLQASLQEDELAPSPGESLGLGSYTPPVEEAPHWRPILDALGAEVAAEFAWVTTTDTIETYEHRETLRYVHIDGSTGEFLNQQCEVVSREKALEHARKPAVVKIVPTPEPEPRVEMFAQSIEPESPLQTFAQVAEPEPFAESFAQFLEPEPLVQPFEQVTEPVTEPELHAFTRTHGLEPETPLWSVLAAKVEVFQPGLSSTLGVFAQIKRRVLDKVASWGTHPFSNNHDTAHASSSIAPDAQQLNFGTFTRRTSVL